MESGTMLDEMGNDSITRALSNLQKTSVIVVAHLPYDGLDDQACVHKIKLEDIGGGRIELKTEAEKPVLGKRKAEDAIESML
ncbi:hypothetical protein L596_016432 [Steinernema carpocapsae]|uniref:Uncharacterized protein n=1 Tax=Steinernema carpocapsae TaxID=34508 RepID=A0A4U5NIW3_STECR|nr:hypothetical protein L596_016432 [Steinernema carpocapsae]